jgi:predicted nucleic acid-binding protein
VAAADARAIICDTGALLDYLVIEAPDHAKFKKAIDSARARYVPSLVLAEVDYFLRDHREAMRRFVHDLRRGAFIFAPASVHQLTRAMEIDERFDRLGLGLCDAFQVVLAEDLGVRRIVTRDVRHFSAVRLRDGSAMEIVVRPSDPDR